MKVKRIIESLAIALLVSACITNREPRVSAPYEERARANQAREGETAAELQAAAATKPDSGEAVVRAMVRLMTDDQIRAYCADANVRAQFGERCEEAIKAIRGQSIAAGSGIGFKPQGATMSGSPGIYGSNAVSTAQTSGVVGDIGSDGRTIIGGYVPYDGPSIRLPRQIPDLVWNTRMGCPSNIRRASDYIVVIQDGVWGNTCVMRTHEGVGACHERVQNHMPVRAAGPIEGGWFNGPQAAASPADCVGQWVWAPLRAWYRTYICDDGCRDDRSRLAIRLNFADAYTADNPDHGHWMQWGRDKLPGMELFGVKDRNGNFDVLLHVDDDGPRFALGGEKSGLNIRW